jgi:hypothetical protein
MRVSTAIVLSNLAFAALACPPAYAHHSFAVYDRKTVVIEGTVNEFKLMNPHSWMRILVNQDAKIVQWSIETGAATMLYRMGIRADTFKPGDKIKLNIRPLKDGGFGGSEAGILELNGKPFRQVGGQAGAQSVASPPAN